MTNSQIFTAAHKRAKELSSNFGSYAKRFSLALKVTYRAVKNAAKKIALKNLYASNEGSDTNELAIDQLQCAKLHNVSPDHAFNLRFGYLL